MWSSARAVPAGIQPEGKKAGRRPRDPPGSWRTAPEPPSPVRELGSYEAPKSPNGSNKRELPSEKFRRETGRIPKPKAPEVVVDLSPAISPVKMSAKAKKDHAALSDMIDRRQDKVLTLPILLLCGQWRRIISSGHGAALITCVFCCVGLTLIHPLCLSRNAWKPGASSRTRKR